MPTQPAFTSTRIDAPLLRRWLGDGQEIALLDVREEGQYGEGHPFLAVNLPYSRLELEAARLLPCLSTRIVLLDDADGIAPRAMTHLAALGYTNLHWLAGGAQGWQAAGYTLFKGVNVPSKTFGELVHSMRGTPEVSAQSLQKRQAAGEPLLLVDGRTPQEHRRMTIPGAVPLPNGELALRVDELLADAHTPVVVHCAGRTRSIIGAQTLRDLGLPNPVLALENGTQGWRLSGLDLEHDSVRDVPARPGGAALPALRERAATLAARHGARVLTHAAAQAWLDDATRSTYVIDVRTAAEYAAGTLHGAVHVPGGQLIQATDQYVAVRGSRLILLDDEDVRAPVVASWMRQLGFEAVTVESGIHAALRIPAFPVRASYALPDVDSTMADLPELDTRAVRALLDGDSVVWLDLRSSRDHRLSHPLGSRWAIRPRITEGLQPDTRIALIADRPGPAHLAAWDLRQAGHTDVSWVRWATWQEAGLPVASSPQHPTDAQAIDFLLFVHDRHDGNLDAARRYLAWETGLIAQCSADELATFRL